MGNPNPVRRWLWASRPQGGVKWVRIQSEQECVFLGRMRSILQGGPRVLFSQKPLPSLVHPGYFFFFFWGRVSLMGPQTRNVAQTGLRLEILQNAGITVRYHHQLPWVLLCRLCHANQVEMHSRAQWIRDLSWLEWLFFSCRCGRWNPET
jgi:hypothetical protein